LFPCPEGGSFPNAAYSYGVVAEKESAIVLMNAQRTNPLLRGLLVTKNVASTAVKWIFPARMRVLPRVHVSLGGLAAWRKALARIERAAGPFCRIRGALWRLPCRQGFVLRRLMQGVFPTKGN